MRVVIYNFVQSDDRNRKTAGGVGIYQANLIEALRTDGHDVIALSSGDRYDFFPGTPYLRTYSDSYERAVIVNSPMIAPAHDAFPNIGVYSTSTALDFIARDFRVKYGDVDVFHFQNIEGLTAGFIRALRLQYPGSAFLLSVHNYNSVCPQVNLWYREHRACENYHEGKACVNCVTPPPASSILNRRRLETIFHFFGTKKGSRVEHGIGRIAQLAHRVQGILTSAPKSTGGKRSDLMSSALSDQYREYRQTNMELARETFDVLLAVSKRTRQVMIARGAPAEKISVSYIGTAHSEKFDAAIKIQDANNHVHMAFLGYMRSDKGFYFLLDALFSLGEHVAKNMSLTFAAPVTDRSAIDRLREMAHRFRAIHIYDGYTHENLDAILQNVNLGIIPVLWEDNLPQVAIELVSRGIPILTSDRGGAQEISSSPEFVFRSGSRLDLCEKLSQLVDGEISLGSFWNKPSRVISMKNHLVDILGYYQAGAERRLTSDQA